MIGGGRGNGGEFLAVEGVADGLFEGERGKGRRPRRRTLVEGGDFGLVAQRDPKAAAGIDEAGELLHGVIGETGHVGQNHALIGGEGFGVEFLIS